MYDSSEYAHSRLSDTIIRLDDGSPILVMECFGNRAMGGIGVRYIPLELSQRPGQDMKTCSLKEVDISPVPLGFCQVKGGAAYLARVPKRRDWRQGLRNSNYTSLYGKNHRLVNHEDLARTIRGIYPGFEFAVDEAVNNDILVSFSRHFCVGTNKKGDKNPAIFHRWHGVVGDIINGQPLLFSGKEHLQESLGEAL